MSKQFNCLEGSKSLREMCLQVKLRRGNESRVMWANADKCIKGNTVKVEEDDGTWSEGWVVEEVHGPPVSKTIIAHRSHEHTTYRKRNDY